MKNKSPKSKEARLGDLIHSITRRDPSKRQIKPINTDNLILDDLDDESDDEYVFDGKDDDSSSDGSESGSQDEDEDSSSQGSESDESESGNSCTDNAEVEVIDVDTSKEGKNSTQKSAACITELLTNDLSGPPNALDKVSLEAEGLLDPRNPRKQAAYVRNVFAVSPLQYDWQSSKPCVGERVRSLFLSTTLADVYFNLKCNDDTKDSNDSVIKDQRVPAHSLILAISSAVFEAMFFGPMSSGCRRAFIQTATCSRGRPCFSPNALRVPSSASLSRRLSSPTLASCDFQCDSTAPEPMLTDQFLNVPLSVGTLPAPSEECRKAAKRSSTPYGCGNGVAFRPSTSEAPSFTLPIEIHLEDVNPTAFVNVLRFIYTDEIILDPSNVLQTLYVAKKYAITVMEHACVDFLSQAITVENALMLLAQANFFDEIDLAQKCLEVIDKNTAKALDSDEFLTIDQQLLCSILERDTLCIREVRLFLSVVKWAKAQYYRCAKPNESTPDYFACLPLRHSFLSAQPRFPYSAPCTERYQQHQSSLSPLVTPPRPASTPLDVSSSLNHKPTDSPQVPIVERSDLPAEIVKIPIEEQKEPPTEALQDILADVLMLIRFPQMTVEEFAEVVVPTNILGDARTVQLFLYFVSHTKPEIPYSTKPRCFLRGAEEIVRRFGAVDQRWDYRGTSDRIRFMVDQKIFVVGFGLYGSIHGPSEYEASIEIVHPESGVVLGSNEVTYVADGSPNAFRVTFKEPIPLAPNVNYLASVTIKGQDTFYGTRGFREIVHECSSASKVTFRFSYAACTNNGTSVEDGQIPEIIFFV